jgi:hypothetical protein
MTEAKDEQAIKVNRAPVLTLWAAVVAERLGHDWETALTLGRAVAGSSARVKAKAIGIAEDEKQGGDLRDEARGSSESKQRLKSVHLLGRDVPVLEERGALRALDHDKAASPKAAAGYVERALGKDLAAVRKAMEDLAASMQPDELNRVGFRLYEHFRPDVPAGAKGWGAKGVLDLNRIRSAGS